MKKKGLTLIEIVIVITIIILLASIAGIAVKTITTSSKNICSISLINSLLSLGRATASKEGFYAGVYFHDQNDALCAMDVIDLHDPCSPFIRLGRIDGSQTKEVGERGNITESVVLFSPSGRLVIKDIMVGNYRGNSSRSLNINGKEYYINTYTGHLIIPRP